MDRLTRWNGKKYVLPQGHGVWRQIAERLAAYEDTGLEPEEIQALKAQYRQAETVSCDNCTDRGHCPEYQSGAACVLDRKTEGGLTDGKHNS